MPVKNIRGIDIVYEVPGGRRSLIGERTLATYIAEAGFRTLIHDRRNMGGTNESHEQAEDLLALLKELDAGPAYIAGSSSGARMSIFLNTIPRR